MAKKVMISQADRRKVGSAIRKVLKPTYFKMIPLDELFDVLKKFGIVPLQEDYTEWSGFLLGSEGETFFRLAPERSLENGFYKPYENTGLKLTWYKATSRRDGKFEVIGYLS